MAQDDLNLFRPFFVRLERFIIENSVVYYDIDVVSQHLDVSVYRRYSDFLELNSKLEREIGGPLPDWVPPFPRKMLSLLTTSTRLQMRMHQLENWLSALVRYSKSLVTADKFDSMLVRLLIEFLDIEKIYHNHHVEPSGPYKTESRPRRKSKSGSPVSSVFTFVREGDIGDLRERLEHNIQSVGATAAFSQRDAKGETLLHAASATGRVEVVEVLMEMGAAAAINLTSSNFDDSALHFACMEENVEIAKLLVSHGADVNAINSTGKSALHYACRYSFDLVKFLIEHGADYNQKNHDNASPLHLCCWYCVEAASYLLDIGSSLGTDDKDNRGFTPFLCAVSGGRIKEDENRLVLMEQLMDRGADIHALDGTGKNAIHLCCTTDDKELAMRLISDGVDPRALDQQNRNALQTAIQHSSVQMVSYLLIFNQSNPIDVYHCDDNGENCLHTAAAAISDEIFDIIWTKYNPAVRPDLFDAPDLMGMTPLHLACMVNRKHAATTLIRARANVEKTNESGKTPLDLVGDASLKEELQELQRIPS